MLSTIEREKAAARSELAMKVAYLSMLREQLGEVDGLLESADSMNVAIAATELTRIAKRLRAVAEQMTVLREELRGMTT